VNAKSFPSRRSELQNEVDITANSETFLDSRSDSHHRKESMHRSGLKLFDLTDLVVVITGAGGLLGQEHALAVGRAGGTPVLLELSPGALKTASGRLNAESIPHLALEVDLTKEDQIKFVSEEVHQQYGGVWGLINNLASNPPMGVEANGSDRLETFPLAQWDQDLKLGLTSAFLCARYFGEIMAQAGGGSIINVASDLALIAPDHRIYIDGNSPELQPPVKPVSYSVVKSGILGLTRYLSTYWSPIPIRSNALVPGSVMSTQNSSLIQQLNYRIPLARLAEHDEYHGAVVFLLSQASAYMTGANLVMDGGRTAW
jgi:NAD(P)-dependent dehydrogenase (short-subunit alcohol dehydrogenase family)